MVSWEEKKEIEEFLSREAHLLDEHRFDEWLELFTDDVEYLIPLREYVQGDVDPPGHPIAKDDKLMLTECGRPFLRNACMFFDYRLRRQQPEARIFSQAL